MDEIMKETKRGTEREKTIGVFGWLVIIASYYSILYILLSNN